MDAISNITYLKMTQKIDEIIRNENLSDYEKKLHILNEVVEPLINANESLRKDNQMAQEELRAMVGARTF